jgi:hypothetical protein
MIINTTNAKANQRKPLACVGNSYWQIGQILAFSLTIIAQDGHSFWLFISSSNILFEHDQL